MDQTASANQELLRYVAKCCENSNLDSNIDLCSGRHNEKTATDRFAPLHNFTDFEYYSF
jgi:hypothetical protein